MKKRKNFLSGVKFTRERRVREEEEEELWARLHYISSLCIQE